MTRGCALGLDFGTASVRALVVETETGRERGSAVVDYRARRDRRGAAGHGRAAAGRLGAAASGRLHGVHRRRRCRRRSRRPASARASDRRHRRGLHLLHDPAGGRARARALPPARVGGAAARVGQALEAPRRAAPGGPDQRARRRARRGVPRPTTAARRRPSGSFAKALQVLEEDPEVYAAAAALRRGGRLARSGALGRAACATRAARATRGSGAASAGSRRGSFFAALDPRFAALGGKARRRDHAAGPRASAA